LLAENLRQGEKFRKKCKALRRSHLRDLKAQEETAKESQKVLNDVIAGLRTKLSEGSTLTRKLTEALEQSERRIQGLESELAGIGSLKREMDKRISRVEERCARDKRMGQAEMTARVLEIETNLYEKYSLEKAKLAGENRRILEMIADSLGSAYGVYDAELDLRTCQELLTRASREVRRMCG
jgi:chromosome segregation ATPase